MESSSMAESRVSARRRARRRAPNPALAAVARSPQTVEGPAVAAAAAAAAVEREPFPDVLPRFKEGFLDPNNKMAKNEDASSDEEEEYTPKWPDFGWVHSGCEPKVTFELNLPRVTIFVDCTEDSDDELCRPLTRRAPTNAEIEAMVEDLRVVIKRWTYFYP